MKMTVVAVSAPALTRLSELNKRFQEKWPQKQLTMKLFYIAEAGMSEVIQADEIQKAIAEADVAVIDTMGASAYLQEIVREGLLQCQGQRIVIGNVNRDLNRLGAFSMETMKMMKKSQEKEQDSEPQKKPAKNAGVMMHRMRRMAVMMGTMIPMGMMKDMKNLFILMDYWQQAEETDMESFLYLILRQYGKMKDLPKEKPCTMRYGIYLKDPVTGECTDNAAAFRKKHGFGPDKPVAALLFYGHCYPNDFYPVVKSMFRQLEKTFHVLPVAFSQNEDKDLKKLEELLTQGREKVAAVVNLMPFRLGAGPMGGDADGAVEILKQVDVPYFKPFCLTKVEKEAWQQETTVNAGEFLISIMLPELDGGIHTYPVGIIEEKKDADGLKLTCIEPMEERIAAFCRRVQAWTALQKKPNREKKVAIVCYNYPPGEGTLFGGAMLDTFASVPVLVEALRAEGYLAETVGEEELKAYFTGACNEPQWNDPRTGHPAKAHGMRNGNLYIGLQPCRVPAGVSEEEWYHDKSVAPPEEYQEFYRYLREDFQADAIIHVGTHGTLEFLPGKDNGITENCWPDRLSGDVPHIYYYYMGNPSEAMTAKRRSNAVLVSYAPPAFKEGGLTAEYQQLKEVMAEYRESLSLAPERSGDLLKAGKNMAVSLHLIGPEEEKTAEKIERLLEDYETSLIPDGLHIMDQTEADGILKALSGRYLPAAPGGDVLKNPEVFPAGRNLVQFDPRLIPTQVAYERGARIARQTLEGYQKKYGRYPDSTAVILWGLETCKTQGETVGQIMEYLGVRLVNGKGSFDSRFALIPAEELTHPRIDVVIHICGFFRDMYPNLLNEFNEVFRRLEELDEPDEISFYGKNTRKALEDLRARGFSEEEARELAGSRIFGPKAGEYGTSLTQKVRQGSWEREEELAEGFMDSLSYVYSGLKQGQKVENLLEDRYRQVEMMSQVRNNVEYELIDLDHYYEFYGGLASSIEKVRGCKAEMLVADTVGDRIRLYDVKESLEKGIRTRLLNPAWIDGMMKHDYHGVSQISKRFENVLGFAATTGQIGSEVFSDLEACYVADEQRKKQLQKANPWSYLTMLNRLAEAKNRGYWKASKEELEMLQNVCLETEGQVE